MGVSVLVVGGTDYLGSHVAGALARAGHAVAILDSRADETTLPSVLAGAAPAVVIHCGVRSGISDSIDDPAAFYRRNVAGTLALLEGLLTLPSLPSLVFSSSAAVYGDSEEPLSELALVAPANPYARTLRVTEEMLSDFGAAYGLRSVILRSFHAAGARAPDGLSPVAESEAHLLPRLLRHARDPRHNSVQIFGDDYPTADGTCVRDYIHVEDLAEAHLRATEFLLKGGSNDIFNVGTNRGSTVRDVIRAVERVTGKKLHVPVGPRRPGDTAHLVGGSKKARNLLGFVLRHDLDSIVRSAWDFTKEQGR